MSCLEIKRKAEAKGSKIPDKSKRGKRAWITCFTRLLFINALPDSRAFEIYVSSPCELKRAVSMFMYILTYFALLKHYISYIYLPPSQRLNNKKSSKHSLDAASESFQTTVKLNKSYPALIGKKEDLVQLSRRTEKDHTTFTCVPVKLFELYLSVGHSCVTVAWRRGRVLCSTQELIK